MCFSGSSFGDQRCGFSFWFSTGILELPVSETCSACFLKSKIPSKASRLAGPGVWVLQMYNCHHFGAWVLQMYELPSLWGLDAPIVQLSWTETARRKFVCVCVCKLPCRSGTPARGGNKKRDNVFSCPLQRTHGYQLKPSATHISNTTTALQSNTPRPCACRKLGK